MSEQVELIHEVYIDENSIDESTLPDAVQSKIKDIDVVIDEYNEMDEDDDRLDDLEAQIEAKSKVLKNMIEAHHKANKVDEVKVDEVKVDEVKVDEVKVDEVKVDEVKVDEVKVDEVKVDEVKVDEVKVDEVKPKEKKKSPFFWMDV